MPERLRQIAGFNFGFRVEKVKPSTAQTAALCDPRSALNAKVPSRNNIYKTTQEFWRLARRERGAYPNESVTSEQRCQPAKEQVSL
jgi:hypothetical protein